MISIKFSLFFTLLPLIGDVFNNQKNRSTGFSFRSSAVNVTLG